jgi:transposase InsO family protein
MPAKTQAGWWKRAVVECSYWRRIHKAPVLWEPRMVVFLKAAGHTINRKRVQRLMRHMGLIGGRGRIPAVRTRRTMFILTCCEVFPWSDPIRYGLTSPTSVWPWLLPVAIMDWYSRRVLSWRTSNSMEAIFCVDCLEEALHSQVYWNRQTSLLVWMDAGGHLITSS